MMQDCQIQIKTPVLIIVGTRDKNEKVSGGKIRSWADVTKEGSLSPSDNHPLTMDVLNEKKSIFSNNLGSKD